MAGVNGFPSSPAAKVKAISIGSAANLPVSAKDGTIAVITALAIHDVHVQASAPSSPNSGDLWIWAGGESRAPLALSNYITLYPRASFQWTGSTWSLKVSYARVSGSWIELTLSVYENGHDILAVTSLYSSEDGANCFITKETSRIFVHNDVPGDHKGMWVSTETPIDLTNVSSIRFNGYFSSDGDRKAGVGSTKGAQESYVNLPTTRGDVSLDVSGLTGSYYINFWFGGWNYAGLLTGYIYEIELVR